MTMRYVRFFDQIGIGDVPLVGGKNASLGEMICTLESAGVQVPNGYAVTADGYRYMLDRAGAWNDLHATLDSVGVDDLSDLADRGRRARRIVYEAGLPEDLEREILAGYRELQTQYGKDVSLAVRSSATSEDLPNASFAGQHETYLNVRGEEHLLEACRRCYASLFLDRAIHYRVDQGFDHMTTALSIGIMKMVRSDLACSGVMFSLDTETGFRDVVLLSGAYGLGENVVQGAVDPDEFIVHKPTYLAGHRAVLRRRMGSKAVKMLFAAGGVGQSTRSVATSTAEQAQFCLSDLEVLELAGYACAIESHYGRPMDMEWAKDGIDGRLYLVQARPETSASTRDTATSLERYILDGPGEVITEGRAVGERIAAGQAHQVTGVVDLAGFRPGEVLVSDTTTPDWEPS